MTITSTGAEPRFLTGLVCVTTGADKAVVPEDIQNALARHERGDWGEVCPEDGDRNEMALIQGGGFHSVYHDRKGVEFWVITEADRSVTTVLLPDDY
jgi:hypothetical protein